VHLADFLRFDGNFVPSPFGGFFTPAPTITAVR
jgi:hypothetical protein